MKCSSTNVSYGISIFCFSLSTICGVIFLFNHTNTIWGESALFLLALTLLMWVISANVKQDDKTKVTPV